MNAELALLGRILSLAEDDEVRIHEFGRAVGSSPNLSAQVVKVANSALYGMEGRITGLERAVMILGVGAVGAIASSVLMSGKLRTERLCELPANTLWVHSLEIAAASELLARCLGWPNEPEAYLVGLLHDLGTLAMQQEHGARYCEQLTRAKAQDLDLDAVEKEALNDTHGDRLKRLCAQWGFPALLGDVFAFHHRPEQAPEKARALASLVYAAHIVASKTDGRWTDQAPEAPSHEKLLSSLGLSRDDIGDVRSLLQERLKELMAAFGG